MLPIVLAVVPAEAGATPNAVLMLEACTAASHAGPCELATVETRSRARVQITWASALSVELQVLDASDEHRAARTLQFDARDAEGERWRTVGFTAALMSESEQTNIVEPKRETASTRLWLLAKMGNGLSTSPRAGAELGIDVLPWSAPLSFGASAEYAVTPSAPQELSARWFGVTAGPGWAFAPASDLAAILRVEALLQQRHLSAKRGPEIDTASEWVLGARLHADVAWPSNETWAGVVGFDGCIFNGPTAILREDKHVAEIPGFAVSVGVGLRVLP